MTERSRDRKGDEELSGSMEENLLTVLFHYDKAGRQVAAKIDPTMFTGPYRTVAERGLAYWKKYNHAPKAHAFDIFDGKGGKTETYARIVRHMATLAPQANREYILDQLNEFHRQQAMKSAILKSAETLERGGEDAAAAALDILRPLMTATTSTTTRVLTSKAVADFDSREIEWLWYPFIPAGMVTILFGDGAVGKSTVALDLAARITKGLPLPRFGDEAEVRARKGSVVILSKEEDFGLIIKPRLEAAGADVTRIHTLGYAGTDGDRDFNVIDRLDTTMGEVEQLIETLGDVRLLIIDPITDFTGKTDIYRDDAVRAFLSPLTRVAAKYGAAFVVILHLNKKSESGARHRVMGSVAFPNVSRSSILIAKAPDDEDRRYMVQEKANLTATKRTVAFRLRNVRGQPRIAWEQDWQTVDVNEVLTAKGGPTKNKQAAELLRELLADGPKPATEVQDSAERLGIGASTLKAAKKVVGVRSTKSAEEWWWSLPKRVR
ncbi:MAG: AAA family ATPase [Pseudolabrys sp.]|nr:AAA family ATPase [Pseudolabrys sp.]